MEIQFAAHTPSAADRAVERAGMVARQLQSKTVDKGSPLYQVCLEFEAIFIKQMLNSMRKTVATETNKALKTSGLATKEEVAELKTEIEELKAMLAAALEKGAAKK